MFCQFVINGLISGILYSLSAIGFSLVLNTTRIFNIGQAGIYVLSAFVFWFFSKIFGGSLFIPAVLAIIVSIGLSLLTELCIYRPLKRRNASHEVELISSIGIMTVLTYSASLIFGNEPKVFDTVDLEPVHIGSVILTSAQLWQSVVGLPLIVAFLLLLKITDFGIRIRALSADSVLYESFGFHPNGLRTIVFIVSGAFIGTACCLTVFDVGLDSNIGWDVFIYAVVSMIIGGVGNIGFCFAGGLLLGLLQSLSVYLFSSNWQNAVTFLILLLFLFLRPAGIAGYKHRVA